MTIQFASRLDGPISGTDPIFTTAGVTLVKGIGTVNTDFYTQDDSGRSLFFSEANGLFLDTIGGAAAGFAEVGNAGFDLTLISKTDRIGFVYADQGSQNVLIDFFDGATLVGSTSVLFPGANTFSGFQADNVGEFFNRVTVRASVSGGAAGFGLARIVLQGNLAAVPEPASMGLLGAGMMALALRRRRLA